MKALTLRQPWAYAVMHLGKRVENRTTKPPAALVGERIAIHAGLTDDWEGGMWIERAGLGSVSAPIGPIVKGAIVATARIAGWHDDRYAQCRGHATDGGYTCVDVERSPWFYGPIGILLTDVCVLTEPVPCRGMQGYWSVPPDVEMHVLVRR